MATLDPFVFWSPGCENSPSPLSTAQWRRRIADVFQSTPMDSGQASEACENNVVQLNAAVFFFSSLLPLFFFLFWVSSCSCIFRFFHTLAHVLLLTHSAACCFFQLCIPKVAESDKKKNRDMESFR